MFGSVFQVDRTASCGRSCNDFRASLEVTLRFRSQETDGARAQLRFGDAERERPVTGWQSDCRFEAVEPGPGPARLEAWIEADRDRYGVRYATLERVDVDGASVGREVGGDGS